MAYITSVNEQKIIDNISIPTYYNEQIVPNRGGFRLISPERPSGICPFHDDTDPSFHFWPDKKMFYCFGCKAAGSVIQMHMRWQEEYNGRKIDKKTAIKELGYMYNIELELDEDGDIKTESPFSAARRKMDSKQYHDSSADKKKLTISEFRTFNNQVKNLISKSPYIMGEQAANMFYKLDLTLSAYLADKKDEKK